MKLGDHDFVFVCDIDPVRNEDGSVKDYMPQVRYKNLKNIPINKYGTGPFCKFKIPNHYQQSGVYLFLIDGIPRYIGECVNLSKRFNMGYGNISPRNCFAGGQETNCRINNLVYQAALAVRPISLHFLATENYKVVEENLRRMKSTDWNRI